MFITDARNLPTYAKVLGSSGAGFSLRGGVLARTKTHRLKPAPLRLRLAQLLVLSFAVVPASAQQAARKTAPAPAPKQDLSGLWHYEGTGASEPIAPDNLIPPMTPWAQAKFDAERPGYGPRRAPGGNDPILQCDPMGFPRIMFLNTPFEFVQAPGRVIQFFEHEHEYRSIWTDGRSLPKEGDADPTWYGHAIGHWEGDDTLVVESTGFVENTWLGSTGYPHSEAMRVIESYRRTDHDTILYDITITDPKAYTKPIVGPHRIMKLRPHEEMGEEICVPSEEKSFADRIAKPAITKPSK
jgi:hypothetical protein